MMRADWRRRTAGRALWASAALLLLAPSAPRAQAADAMVLHDSDGLVVRGHFQAGVNAVAEQNLFWNMSKALAPTTRFDADKEWLELYAKPGISFYKQGGGGTTLYGMVSGVASATVGTDAFDTGDTGRVTLEEGFIGVHTRSAGGLTFDLSVGPREYSAGTGMLISNGGSSGFDRGALKLGPHRAWEMAVLGKVGYGKFTGTGFYVDANEQSGGDSGTKIAGVDLRYDGQAGTFAGMSVGQVLQSGSPYPKAAPNGIGAPSILPGARDGLKFVSLYGRAYPFSGAFENAFIAGDLAIERNNDIDLKAWAGRIQVGYTFASAPWSPTLSYAYQTFSGDDPSTTRLERFDPLYYEGSPSSWSTGSKSAMVFINSNVNSHQLTLRTQPTPRDTLTLRYAHISANELRSPIQFGQATRVEIVDGVVNPIAGVTRAHLSDDVFLEYNRALNRNTYLTAGFSVSVPGAGVDSVVNNDAPIWTGGFVNVVVNF